MFRIALEVIAQEISDSDFISAVNLQGGLRQAILSPPIFKVGQEILTWLFYGLFLKNGLDSIVLCEVLSILCIVVRKHHKMERKTTAKVIKIRFSVVSVMVLKYFTLGFNSGKVDTSLASENSGTSN